MPAGDDWQSHVRTERALGIAGVEISAADPEAMARHWQAMLGAPENEPRIALADADLRFVPVGEKGPGVDTVRLRCSDADAVRRAADLRGLRDGDAIRWCGTRLELA
jgi:hypothetical protein